jgi:gamma-glutamyltranspeptidase/glutathione hydrolase
MKTLPAGWNWLIIAACLLVAPESLTAAARPLTARHGMVVTQDPAASRVGCDVLLEGGNAVDAAVAAAFALAVTHPAAGNIGGGGFSSSMAPGPDRVRAPGYFPGHTRTAANARP